MDSEIVNVMGDEPRLLLIETSGRGGFVALARGESPCGVRQLEESRRHARDLAPMTSDLLREQGWKPRDVQGVLVSLGPGSYTGLRVGVVAAKTLAYATGCVLLGLETFAVIAEQAPMNVNVLDVIADAQQEKVYGQRFRRENERMVSVSTLMIQPLAEWLATRDPATLVSGPGVDAYTTHLKGLTRIETALRGPTLQGMLSLGLRRYRAGERDDPWQLEPIYCRPSAAEEQWKKLGRT